MHSPLFFGACAKKQTTSCHGQDTKTGVLFVSLLKIISIHEAYHCIRYRRVLRRVGDLL